MFFAHHCERKWLGIYMRWSCWTLESENTINTIVRDPLGYNWRRMLVNLFTTTVFAKLPRNIQVHMFSYKFLRYLGGFMYEFCSWITLHLTRMDSSRIALHLDQSRRRRKELQDKKRVSLRTSMSCQYRFLPEANTIQQMRTVFGSQFRLKIEPFASKRHRHGLSSRCVDAPCMFVERNLRS
jgi:hypothetical protein